MQLVALGGSDQVTLSTEKISGRDETCLVVRARSSEGGVVDVLFPVGIADGVGLDLLREARRFRAQERG